MQEINLYTGYLEIVPKARKFFQRQLQISNILPMTANWYQIHKPLIKVSNFILN